MVLLEELEESLVYLIRIGHGKLIVKKQQEQGPGQEQGTVSNRQLKFYTFVSCYVPIIEQLLAEIAIAVLLTNKLVFV